MDQGEVAVQAAGQDGGLVSALLLWGLRTDGLMRRALSSGFSRPGYEIPQELVAGARGVTHHALAATTQAADGYLGERATPDRLTAVGKPLLVIFGAEDRRWRPLSAAQYHAVPGARVEVLPGIGHSPMLEDPPATAALLLTLAAT